MSAILDGSNAAKQEDKLVMDYSEAAAFLGVSERSLERYVREGLVPYVRLPKRGAWAGVRFLRPDLLKWLEHQTVRPRRLKSLSLDRGNA